MKLLIFILWSEKKNYNVGNVQVKKKKKRSHYMLRAGVGKLQPIVKIKFYWTTAMHIQLRIVYGYFCATRQNQQF